MHKESVDAGIRWALRRIDKSAKANDLLFHNIHHTQTVIERVERMGHMIGLPKDEINIAKVAGAFHDVDWECAVILLSDKEIIRQSKSSINEKMSVLEMLDWADTCPDVTLCEKELMDQSIMATIALWSDRDKTAFQPNLRVNSHPVVRLLALADLGTAGIEGKHFIQEAHLRFRERNLDIELYTSHAKNLQDISVQKQEVFKQRILSWYGNQVEFTKGRKARFEFELGNLHSMQKDSLRLLFSKFDEAIESTQQVFERYQQESFWSIAKDMGCSIP